MQSLLIWTSYRFMRQQKSKVNTELAAKNYPSWGTSDSGLDTSSQSKLLPIIRLQQTAIRRTLNVNNSSCNFMSVYDLYKIYILKEYYKDTRYRTPPRRHGLNTRSNSLRNGPTFNIEGYRNNYGRRTNSHIVPSIHNNSILVA